MERKQQRTRECQSETSVEIVRVDESGKRDPSRVLVVLVILPYVGSVCLDHSSARVQRRYVVRLCKTLLLRRFEGRVVTPWVHFQELFVIVCEVNIEPRKCFRNEMPPHSLLSARHPATAPCSRSYGGGGGGGGGGGTRLLVFISRMVVSFTVPAVSPGNTHAHTCSPRF